MTIRQTRMRLDLAYDAKVFTLLGEHRPVRETAVLAAARRAPDGSTPLPSSAANVTPACANPESGGWR